MSSHQTLQLINLAWPRSSPESRVQVLHCLAQVGALCSSWALSDLT